jgi:pyruvate/2-oxoglutarate/acetoin dehydrogenase E1 component
VVAACDFAAMDKDFLLPLDKAQVVRQGTDVTITAFSKVRP